MQYLLVPDDVSLVIGDQAAVELASEGMIDFRVFVGREVPVVRPAAPKIKFPVPRARRATGKPPGRPPGNPLARQRKQA